MRTAAVRNSDGLMADVQESPMWPADTALRLQNMVNKFGGTLDNWQLKQIPDEQWQSPAVIAGAGINPLARQFYAAGGEVVITQSTPPAMSQDKAQIENDGADTVTFTADVGDAGYTGAVDWTVTAPDGTREVVSENASAGVSTLEFVTNDDTGTYTVQAETELHGIARASVEVV